MKATLLAAALVLVVSGNARAHNVYVFAWVDGDTIQVEGRFSKKNKVKNGKVLVADATTGENLLEGVTDAEGVFRFRLPEDFLSKGHGIAIQLQAGAGHQADWKMSYGDLSALARADGALSVPVPPTPEISKEAATPAPPSPPDWEARVGRMLDERLAPIKQALARQEEREPDFREVVGGLGWIMGLLGVATWMKYGRRTKNDSGS